MIGDHYEKISLENVLRHTKESVLGRRVDFVYILDTNVVALLCYLEKDR